MYFIISEVFNHSQKDRWLMSYFSYWYVLLILLIFLYDKGYHPALCYLWFILPIDLYLITLSGVLEYIIINNVSRECSDEDTWLFHLWRASLPWHFSIRFSWLTLNRLAKKDNSVNIYSDIMLFFITFFLLWSIKSDISICPHLKLIKQTLDNVSWVMNQSIWMNQY